MRDDAVERTKPFCYTPDDIPDLEDICPTARRLTVPGGIERHYAIPCLQQRIHKGTHATSARTPTVDQQDDRTPAPGEHRNSPAVVLEGQLLRALESGEVQRVGSTERRTVDVRFVAATHHDLRALIEQRDFREDLFYRLHAQRAIRLPALRQRSEDIPILAQHFLELANRENGASVAGIAPEVMRRLTNYGWRGNVRELRSVIAQMVIETDNDVLQLDDLPDSLQATTDLVPTSGPTLAGLSMADVEKLHILNTLKLTGGNREKAAKILKIGTRTLYRRLRDYGVT